MDLNLKLSDEEEALPDGQVPVLKMTCRFCYSKQKFLEGLLVDLQALISQEQEHIEYLDCGMNNINDLIVKS